MATTAMRTFADATYEFGSPFMLQGVLVTIWLDGAIEDVKFFTLTGLNIGFFVLKKLSVLWDRKYGPQDPAPIKAPAPDSPP